ncbi:MAG: hypothetical protein DRN00_00860 [Thermoplasmata archaeon]|nr:MAG: hypothetical protein DRN00_00860 [Thermoplasmata archaeon]
MKIIQLAYAENDKFISGEPSFKGEFLYIMDIGGLLRNEPSLELYQKISPLIPLWIDSAPRRYEDVMDIVVAGASKVTIRREIFEDNLESLFKEIEIDFYEGVDIENCTRPIGKWKGRVVYVSEEPSFEEKEKLAFIASKFPTYVVLKERNLVDLEWMEGIGVEGVILHER